MAETMNKYLSHVTVEIGGVSVKCSNVSYNPGKLKKDCNGYATMVKGKNPIIQGNIILDESTTRAFLEWMDRMCITLKTEKNPLYRYWHDTKYGFYAETLDRNPETEWPCVRAQWDHYLRTEGIIK